MIPPYNPGSCSSPVGTNAIFLAPGPIRMTCPTSATTKPARLDPTAPILYGQLKKGHFSRTQPRALRRPRSLTQHRLRLLPPTDEKELLGNGRVRVSELDS